MSGDTLVAIREGQPLTFDPFDSWQFWIEEVWAREHSGAIQVAPKRLSVFAPSNTATPGPNLVDAFVAYDTQYRPLGTQTSPNGLIYSFSTQMQIYNLGPFVPEMLRNVAAGDEPADIELPMPSGDADVRTFRFHRHTLFARLGEQAMRLFPGRGFPCR